MPDDTAKTIKEIVADSDAVHAELAQQEAALQTEIGNIDDIEWERPLNDAERQQRKDLRAALTDCRAAMIEMSFVTLRALDQAPEVKRLANALKSINAELKDSLKRVEKIASIAKTIPKVLAGIEKVAGKLAKFLV